MPREIVIPYVPTPKQKQFHECRARYRALVAGVGAGKSTAGANEAIKSVLKDPNGLGMIIAPSYNMLTQATMRSFFQYMPKELITSFNKEENSVKLRTGGEILFRSFDDPERLRGPNLSWFWMDEGSIGYGEAAWNIMVGRLRTGLERGWVTCTPRGQNWVYDKFVRHKTEAYELIPCTTFENPHLSKEFLESLKDTYGIGTPFYRQEVLGDFVVFEGLVYPEYSDSVHLIAAPEKAEWVQIVAGIDFGYRNPWAVVFVAQYPDGNLHIIDEIYQREITFDQFLQLLTEKRRKLQFGRCFCDPSRPEHIAALNKAGIPAYKAKNDIVHGIQVVKSFLANFREDGLPKLLVDPKCKNVREEFLSYAYPDSRGQTYNEIPLKENDHALDATRYALVGITRPRPKIRILDL